MESTGIPADRVRYHVCFGSWHVPHVAHAPLEAIVDLILQVNAQAYSLEAANPRHEHEWRVWQKMPSKARGWPVRSSGAKRRQLGLEVPAPATDLAARWTAPTLIAVAVSYGTNTMSRRVGLPSGT